MPITWTPIASPFDGLASGSRFAYSASRNVILGGGSAAGGQVSTDGGETWAAGTCPLSTITDIAYSDSLDRFVAVGTDGAGNFAAYSDDGGATWTVLGNPWGAALLQGNCITRDESQGLFVAGARYAAGSGPMMAYSADGITWTAGSSFWDGNIFNYVNGVCWVAGLATWAAVGLNTGGGGTLLASLDGMTWSELVPNGGPGGGGSIDIKVAPGGATVIAAGSSSASPANAPIRLSTDLVTWSNPSSGVATAIGIAHSIEVDPGGRIVVGGSGLDSATGQVALMESADNGANWTADASPFDGGGEVDGVLLAGGSWFAAGFSFDGSVTLAGQSASPAEPVLDHGEYRNTWRWVVTMLDGSTVKTFLDKLATNVQVAYVLNGDSQQVTMDVPSDDDEVNHLADELPGHGPGKHPRVSQNRRLLYGFRREEGAGLASPRSQPPWTCRWGGVITIVQDEAAEDVAITHVTSHDGWTWAKSLPVLNPDGSPPGANGVTYEGKTAGYVAKDVIANAYAWIVATYPATLPWNDLPNDGQHLLIDIAGGRFDPTDVIPTINFAQGCSVGEAWTQLVQTGTVDIVLEPVWGQPGVINILNVRATVGRRRPNAIFGWGKFPKNLVAADNLLDGTQLANYAQYYAGQVAAAASTQDTSIDAYGPYWQEKSFPAPASVSAVALIAAADAALQKNGKQTVVIDPTPELAPDPFTQYFLGDEVSLVVGTTTKGGGSSFRSRFSGGLANKSHRVYGFQISLADDLTETVTNLLLSDPNSSV